MPQRTQQPNEGEPLGKRKQSKSTVRFSCGSEEMHLDNVVGAKLGNVMRELREALNVTKDHTVVMVNGRQVNDPENHVIQSGEEVEFVKPAGQKG